MMKATTITKKFNYIVQKQALHLLNQIDKIKNYNNRLVGTAAIILVGICYNDGNFIGKAKSFKKDT